MSSNLHGTDYQIKIKQGTRSNLLVTATSNIGVQGEPYYTTDTKQLFIHDGDKAEPVQSLDMACIDDDFDLLVDEEYNLVYDF